jgi:hypothetical protein
VKCTPPKLFACRKTFVSALLLPPRRCSFCPLPRENSPGRWTTITTGENQDAHTKRQRQNRRSRIFQEDRGKTVSYTILVAETKKNSAEEPDVLEFSSLAELKKLRRRCPETMRCTYFYALSSGVDKQFRHIHVAESDHFKQFVRLIMRAGIDI